MIIAIDTNVLIDVLDPASTRHEASRTEIEAASSEGTLIIAEATYAELAPGFESPRVLDAFLDSTRIALVPSSPAALHRAGLAWRAYLRQRGPGLQCPNCGAQQATTCSECGSEFRVRQHLLADFLIGGHALEHADRLLTHDRRYFATFFPQLVLV